MFTGRGPPGLAVGSYDRVVIKIEFFCFFFFVFPAGQVMVGGQTRGMGPGGSLRFALTIDLPTPNGGKRHPGRGTELPRCGHVADRLNPAVLMKGVPAGDGWGVGSGRKGPTAVR